MSLTIELTREEISDLAARLHVAAPAVRADTRLAAAVLRTLIELGVPDPLTVKTDVT